MSAMDPILESWLINQRLEANNLAAESDIVEIFPIDDERARQSYLIRFHCAGYVKDGGEVVKADCFDVGIHFEDSYVKRAPSNMPLVMLSPHNTFHPNISGMAICAGHIYQGMSLTSLISQVYEIITWQKLTMREDDALSREACIWARNNPDRFPVDTRPKAEAFEPHNIR